MSDDNKEFDINEALKTNGFEPIKPNENEKTDSDTSLPEGYDPVRMTLNETPETPEERIARCRAKEAHPEKIPSSVRNSLRQDISRLEDECFGDLPIMQQRMMKSHAMMANKDTYTYDTISPTKETDDTLLPDDSPQTQMAQKLVDKIVKKMMNGNSAASKKLKDFMKGKKIKVHILNRDNTDASCDGFDKTTNELHLSFCSGNFMYQKDAPDIANEDSFAIIVGHEIGHEIEHQNRSSKCSEQATNHSTNGREVESFCDMFGLACAASAGYNLQSYIDKCSAFEYLDEGKTNEPHPLLSQRKRLAQMVKQAYHNDVAERTLFSEEITSMEWYIPKEKQQTTQNKLPKDNSNTM